MIVSKLTKVLVIKWTNIFVDLMIDKMIDKKHYQQKTLSIDKFVISLTR